MKKIKKIVIVTLVALSLALLVPGILPNVGATKVEAAVKISKKKVTLIKGQTKKLKITGTSKKVTWKSSKKSVAAVNSKGKVTAKKKGTAKITATVGKKKYTCTVTVQNPSISKKTASIEVGKSVTLKMKGTNQKVTWKTSNKNVATVKSGKVTGIQTGTATVTATVLKKKYTCKVTVKSASADIIKNASANTLTWVSHKLDKGVLTIVKNNYSYNVSLSLTTVYYSSSGSMMHSSKDSVYCIEPGRECVLFTYGPYDAGKYLDYASYKNTFTAKAAYSSYNSKVSGITWSANKRTNGVSVTVKNTSNPNARFTNLSVVFYKNGKVIGYSTHYASVSTVGSTDTLTFYYPYDSNYNYIVADNYKVYVNYSYN